ncbi:cytosolic 5'-nucleotidase 1B isoform X5 [Bos javanicus]|uniref:cytosolic 5'-nucleotidase 1B isoform X4 n=1 Tax=Bos taurus TaxID=9913 RepID=UPI0003841547|nr:cytosolic 5'-nucleotidase 1B isoform X4 [Bos taurus]XP_061289230.1 cytosolic 5'-nucleotidase 1B isoform X5 [Bos javanicus]
MSQTSLKQKKKNETGSRYSKDSLEGDKSRKDSEKSVRLTTQMRRAVIPNHSLRCCSMRGHPSCRRCLCAAEGKVLLSPCRTIRIYIHMCLLWEQGRQITMIRGSQELTLPKSDSRGYVVRNQWSRTSRSPSTRPPSAEESRSKNTSLKPKPKHAITVAVSSGALFNMMDSRKIYDEEGLEKYMEYQLTNENVVLTPGPAFRFVKALQHVNCRLRELYPDEQDLFDIVLMTNNHAQVGVRLINSVNHYGLLIDRFCLTGGKSPIGYLKAYLTNLYVSADSDKVLEAIQEGIASATMYEGAKDMSYCDTQLRVVFDGDAVLFCEEPEHSTKDHGLDKCFQHEALADNKPLGQGPLKGFMEDLGRLQKKFYAKDERLCCPIRTYLVTARSAASSGARVLKTLRRWGLEIDEALFLAGAPKGPILAKIRPHLFFDDHMFHIEGAQKYGTTTAHVPYGISQK